MKKLYFLVVFFTFLLFANEVSFAQIVGGDVFLQGAYLEIGEDNFGAFGTCTSPVGYHPHVCCGTTWTPGATLAEVYDYGHDGWTVGTPPFMGDYTQPGTPFEGWSLQIGPTEYDNWVYGTNCASIFGAPGVSGSITGYTNSGGVITGTFTGAVAGLNVIAVTEVDTLASAVVVTVKFYNTTGVSIPNVFYERTCDPDNASTWDWGPTTNNVIVHQNDDAAHDVLVSATSNNTTTGYPGTYEAFTYMGLGTKDCRAVCTYFGNLVDDYGLDPDYTPAEMWNMTTTPYDYSYVLGDSNYMDCGIALIFNVGTIAPLGSLGDSAAISFAYEFNGRPGLDSAFPQPQLVIEGIAPPTPFVTVPDPTYDTFDVCSHPGDDTLPINILHGTSRNWTWAKWTWAPATGLTSTIGAMDTIISSVLPPSITYTITGTDSSGTGVMLNCQTKVFYLTIMTCNQCVNNSPCQGDTLYLYRKGDSTGCTYRWVGPPASGFTSTLQDPFIYPSTLADAGEYYVYRTLLGVTDTDSTNVVIHPTPVVVASSNSPLCTNPEGTLELFATPTPPIAGETYSWTGPSFTSALQDPTIASFGPANTGLYKVVTTTPFGCTDSATTDAELVPQPPAPNITGITLYCQGVTFVPFVVTDSVTGAVLPDSTLLWYPSMTGGTGTTTPSTVNTSIPGYYTVYVAHQVGSCIGRRGFLGIRVRTTPPAPLVTGVMRYCQYDTAAYVPLTVNTTPTGSANWYTAPSVPPSGASTLTEPTPNINVIPTPGTSYGIYTYYVTQTDSNCQSLGTTVNIVIDRKPEIPAVHPDTICQLTGPITESATPDSVNTLLWYGPGVTVGTSSAPTIGIALTAPDTIDYYVTQTTPQGCVSDSALDALIVKLHPAAPKTSPVWYCQEGTAQPLNAQVDSSANSYLKWYIGGAPLPSAPVPPTSDSTAPGNTTWYVTQVVNGCESDSAMVTVTILYKPEFSISATQPYVCQFDSISLSYNGPELVAPSYSWTLPVGASFASGTLVYEDSVVVNFDSAITNNYVNLTVSDDSGKCSTTEPIRINIISQPTAQAYTKPDVCLGDTVALALSTRASDAYSYIWYIDYIELLNSQSVTIIASNSGSGGPYSISWVDSGRHIIEVQTFSADGCKSEPSYDTVNVHPAPDADFKITSTNQSGCIDDTVQFSAVMPDYNDSYVWSPAHSFENVNTPVAWGQIEEANTIITLTVTDPFGCVATQSMELDPNSCCTVAFPNAFTPNGDAIDDFFRPLYSGYHRFHVFQIMNRWGQIVFTSINNNMQWDGNYNGVPQDMGVYYYYLKYDCGGKTIEQKGDVTLIR